MPTDRTDSRLEPSTDVDGILQLYRRHRVRTNANISQGRFLGMQGTENLVHLSANTSSSPPNTATEGFASLRPIYMYMYFFYAAIESSKLR